MEYVSLNDVVRKENSPSCIVYEYVTKSSEVSIAISEMNGRYPDEGYAVNEKCNEMGYVLEGSGKLITETRSVDLSAGDVVLIPRGEKYYWEGSLKVLILTAPA